MRQPRSNASALSLVRVGGGLSTWPTTLSSAVLCPFHDRHATLIAPAAAGLPKHRRLRGEPGVAAALKASRVRLAAPIGVTRCTRRLSEQMLSAGPVGLAVKM